MKLTSANLRKVLNDISEEDTFWCYPTIMFYPQKHIKVESIEEELSMHGDTQVLSRIYKMGYLKIENRQKIIHWTGCVEIVMSISLSLKGMWKLKVLKSTYDN